MSAARRHGQHLLPRLSVSRLPAVRRSTEHARRSRRADAHAGSRLFQGGFIRYTVCHWTLTKKNRGNTHQSPPAVALLWFWCRDTSVRTYSLTYLLTYYTARPTTTTTTTANLTFLHMIKCILNSVKTMCLQWLSFRLRGPITNCTQPVCPSLCPVSVSWSLTSLLSTNMAISETNGHSL